MFWEPGRRNSKCKGPGARISLASWRNIKASASQRKEWWECLRCGVDMVGLQRRLGI